jgi:hypothetical protein
VGRERKALSVAPPFMADAHEKNNRGPTGRGFVYHLPPGMGTAGGATRLLAGFHCLRSLGCCRPPRR